LLVLSLTYCWINGDSGGHETFIVKHQAMLGQDKEWSEISATQKCLVLRSLAEYEKQGMDGDHAILLADKNAGYSLKERAAHFGLHYSRVSGIINLESAS